MVDSSDNFNNSSGIQLCISNQGRFNAIPRCFSSHNNLRTPISTNLAPNVQCGETFFTLKCVQDSRKWFSSSGVPKIYFLQKLQEMPTPQIKKTMENTNIIQNTFIFSYSLKRITTYLRPTLNFQPPSSKMHH